MNVLSTHPSDFRGTNALKRALADIDAPGWCVAFGDRIEMLEAANRERYRGRKIVHVGGGETWHNNTLLSHPDHWTRDALSVVSSLHFVANAYAADNLVGLGVGMEDEPNGGGRVFIVGCPSLDEIVAYAKTLDPNRKRKGIVAWFPEDHDKTDNTWHPYARQQRKTEFEFLHDIAHCELFRTNSSAGLREAPILGTPVEMVGSRQAGRAPAGTYAHPQGRACEEIRRIVLEVCR